MAAMKLEKVHVPQSDRILLMYWGRRGLSQFFFELADATKGCNTLVTVSSANENEIGFAAHFQERLLPFDLFETNLGAIWGAWRWRRLRRQLSQWLRENKITTVIDVMPHIWMPVFLPLIRHHGARYIAIAHDAAVHPGDWRSRLAKLSTDYCLRHSDHGVALSQTVATQLKSQALISDTKMSVLFHPDLTFGPAGAPVRRDPDGTMRLAFMGRIMPYKGLPLFVTMVERLRASGVAVVCGVFGEGDLGPVASRLAALDAEIVNHWLDADELAAILNRYDALVASHIEASQSGVVAAALGAGLPVIATPVGGLVEQIDHGVTGIVATAVNAEALASAACRLFFTPGLYETMRGAIHAQAEDRSMANFAKAVLTIAGDDKARAGRGM